METVQRKNESGLHSAIVMTTPALAPTPHGGNTVNNGVENPFTSPNSALPNPPTVPKPCAQSSYNYGRRSSRGEAQARGPDTGHDRLRQHSAYSSHKPGSMSSTGDSAVMTPMSSIDLEKAGLAREQATKPPSNGSRNSNGSKRSRRSRERDLEKAGHNGRNDAHNSSNHISGTYDDDEDEDVDEGRQIQEEKAVKILFFMSGPCVILSAMNTVWACIALIITALAQPIRICARRPSFGQQLAGLLGPTLNLQLRCIYTPLSPHANEDGSYHSFMLVAVHILSPFLSFFMMFAAWVLAIYWLCSGVVGDPAGQDKRDDGKETVLGLRNWWERWLMRCVKEE